MPSKGIAPDADPVQNSPKSAPTAPPPANLPAVQEDSERILVLCPTGRDGEMICAALVHASFEAVNCGSIEELCRELEAGAGAAFVAEEAINLQSLPMLQQALQQQPTWSDVPLLMMTSGGKTTPFSERLARRLQDVANLTLLERPLRILTLVVTLQSALRARRRQYQVRRLVQETEEAVRQRDQFLAMLGHELRNPLAAIRTAVEVVNCAGVNDPKLASEHCEIIKRQATHLSRVVDDLLDVARATAGKIVLDRQRVDLREIVQRSIQDVKLAMGTQRHEILCDTSAQAAMVNGDPVRLEQVVSNLLSNSLKYTPSGGKISIRVAQQDDAVLLSVKDTGEGIPPEMLPRIFDPFVQVEQNLDRARGGLGLGLPLVKALVEMHEGSIHALSEGPGRGSEFTVRLPLALANIEKPEQSTTDHPSGPLARRVLVVEDSPDSRSAMRALIRLWGHQVIVAEDGPSGIQRAQEFKPDVAFVDIGLPGMDGYGVARLIRENLGTSVYLVALTGYGQPEDRERTRKAGFDEHLVKPVEPARLLKLLSEPLQIA